MQDTIVYYRSRPSEPDASNHALCVQREAVAQAVADGRLRVLAEFVEAESEETDSIMRARQRTVMEDLFFDEPPEVEGILTQGRPALEAAICATRAAESASLLVVSGSAIGSGEMFELWHLGRVERNPECWLLPLAPKPEQINLPEGAPPKVSLYSICRHNQGDTLVYLCNGGGEAMSDVVVTTDETDRLPYLRAKPKERWNSIADSSARHWDEILPGRCVLIQELANAFASGHARRVEVTFANPRGGRRIAKAEEFRSLEGAEWLRLDVKLDRDWWKRAPAPSPGA